MFFCDLPCHCWAVFIIAPSHYKIVCTYVHMHLVTCKVSTWFQWLNVVYAQLEIFCTACNGRHGNLHHMPKVRLCCCFQESVLVGPCNIFIGDVTLALKRLGSLAATLFIQLLVQTKNKENIEALHYWPFVRGINRSPVDSPHKMTSNAENFQGSTLTFSGGCPPAPWF